jgi:hypothetical protein
MEPHDRLSFSAIDQRPPLKLPEGLRLIVWPVLALEHWDISQPMARTVISPPQGHPMLPEAAARLQIIGEVRLVADRRLPRRPLISV